MIEEFQAVEVSSTNGKRVFVAVIIPSGENRIAGQEEDLIEGQDIVVLQTKSRRLGKPNVARNTDQV